MKKRHITVIATAAALASCAPYPPAPGQPGAAAASGGEVPAPQVDADRNVPVGRPSPDGKKNMVISPYRPYNLIDVTGYKSGDIVGDPSTATVNPTTGKADLSTAKHFRLP